MVPTPVQPNNLPPPPPTSAVPRTFVRAFSQNARSEDLGAVSLWQESDDDLELSRDAAQGEPRRMRMSRRDLVPRLARWPPGFVPQELVDARTEGSFQARPAERVGDTTVATVDGAARVSSWSLTMRSSSVRLGSPSRYWRRRCPDGRGRASATNDTARLAPVVAGKRESTGLLRASRMVGRGTVRRRQRRDRSAPRHRYTKGL